MAYFLCPKMHLVGLLKVREVVVSDFVTLKTVIEGLTTKKVAEDRVYENPELEALLEKGSCQMLEELAVTVRVS